MRLRSKWWLSGLVVLLQVGAPGQNRVPAPHEATVCGAVPKSGGLPVDEFKRKGGQRSRAKLSVENGKRAKVSVQNGELTVADVAQGRDLQQYDRLRLVDSAHKTVEEKEQNPFLERARTFLFEHWRDRRQAYLSLTLSSVDATGTSHIFLERDGAGRWRVSWRVVRDVGVVDDLPTYYSVEWVVPTDYGKPGTPVPRGAAADPVKDRLAFRDKCGDIAHFSF